MSRMHERLSIIPRGRTGLLKQRIPLLIGAVAILAIGYFLGSSFSSGGDNSSSGRSDRWGRGSGGPRQWGNDYPQGRPTASDEVPVELVSCKLMKIRERVSSSGLLEPEREVTILARVEGEVEEVLVEEGQEIEEGTTLCSIDQEELRIAEKLARIEFEQAKRNFDRLAGLLETKSTSPQEVEDARAALDRSEANHQRAMLDLSHSQPHALFGAMVVNREIEPGQAVRVGDPLFTIADLSPLRIRLQLPESQITEIEVGQSCELRSERTSDIVSVGEVERISPVVDRESLTVEVLVRFEDAADLVRPGSFAHVEIITRVLENALLVPRNAVLREAGISQVFRIVGGIAHKVEVVTGYEDEGVIEIREGLEPGDEVATDGNRDLQDRSKVVIYRRVPQVEEEPLTVEDGESRGSP